MRPFYWKNYPKFVSDDVHWDNPYDRVSFRKWYHIRWLPAWFQKAHAWTTIILILFWWMMGQLTNTEERFHSEPVLRIVSRENRWKNRAVGNGYPSYNLYSNYRVFSTCQETVTSHNAIDFHIGILLYYRAPLFRLWIVDCTRVIYFICMLVFCFFFCRLVCFILCAVCCNMKD